MSILFNLLAGYILAFREGQTSGGGFVFSMDNEVFRLMLGAASVFTGLMKLLSPVAGNIPFIGDIVPALANCAGGLILMVEYYRARSTVFSETAEKLGKLAGRFRKITGLVSIGAALLHFVFYGVILL